MSETQTPPAPDGGTAPPPDAGTPETGLFAGKFDSPQALEQGYRDSCKAIGVELPEGPLVGQNGVFTTFKALEVQYKANSTIARKLAAAKPDDPETPPVDTTDGLQIPEEPAAPEQPATVEAVLESAGLKAEDVVSQFMQNGYLSSEQYEAFAGKGYNRHMVDSYLQGQQAQAQVAAQTQQQIVEKATTLVGGADQLDALLGWAATLPEAVKNDINDRLGDAHKYEGAIIELQSRHKAAVGAGNTQPLITGGDPASGGSAAPTTLKEFLALNAKAMRGDQAAARAVAGINPNTLR